MTRLIASEETMTAGVKRERVLTLVDRLHREGAIPFEQFAAAGIFRDTIMGEIPPSEGVSSYGSNITAAQPSAKADRLGRRLTGFMISLEGRVMHLGSRKSREAERNLEDAIFAAVGVFDQGGRQHINFRHADLLVRVCIQTESMPTLAEITQELTRYYGARSKQPPYALGVISTWLGRMATHYGLVK